MWSLGTCGANSETGLHHIIQSGFRQTFFVTQEITMIEKHPPHHFQPALHPSFETGFSGINNFSSESDDISTPGANVAGKEMQGQQPLAIESAFIDFSTIDPRDYGDQVFWRLEHTLAVVDSLEAKVEQSQFDDLTGLMRRAPFEREFRRIHADQQRIHSAIYDGKGHVRRGDVLKLGLVLLALDIDDFKAINDTHGHPFGDEVIKKIAGALMDVTRDQDLICRHGGDEFLILLNAGVQAGDLPFVGSRIREAIEAIEINGDRYGVGVSMGASEFRDGVSAAEMTAEADAAMYVDKARKSARGC